MGNLIFSNEFTASEKTIKQRHLVMKQLKSIDKEKFFDYHRKVTDATKSQKKKKKKKSKR